MLIGINDEIDGLDYSFIKMTHKEFEKLMFEKFKEIFQDHSKPMSQTCMCWGLSVGIGWAPLLYKVCSQLDVIRKVSGIFPIADQVKEKFGGLRFYYHIASPVSRVNDEEDKDEAIWIGLIEDIINKAEKDSYRICGSCGKFVRHKRIDLGWVYDQCSTCLIKEKPELKEAVEEWLKENGEET